MRIRKVVNRVYEGTVYYRWVLSVPPKRVRELGWVDGQELEMTARGTTLTVSPAVRTRPKSSGQRAESLEMEVQRKSLQRRGFS